MHGLQVAIQVVGLLSELAEVVTEPYEALAVAQVLAATSASADMASNTEMVSILSINSRDTRKIK